MPNLRGIYVLRENLVALMRTRGMTQDELARAVGRKKSWLNKFLKGSRQIQIVDIDRMADYLGVSTYQLFQPGVSRFAERRVGERRTGQDRRLPLQLRSSDTISSTRTSDPDVVSGVPGRDGRAVSNAGELTAEAKAFLQAAARELTRPAESARETAQARKGRPKGPRLR